MQAFIIIAVQWTLYITDTLRPIFFACNTEFSFLRGKSVSRWTFWDQDSLSLGQRFLNSGSPFREVPLYTQSMLQYTVQ